MGTRPTAAAAALSALLLWLASPAVGAAWLIWVALVPVAAVVVAAPAAPRARWAVPLCYGLYLQLLLVPSLPFGLTEGQFGDPPLPILVGDSPVFFVALVAVPLFAAALWALGFGRPSGPLTPLRAPGVLILVLVPAASWTVLDYLRANLDPGGMWGPLYLSQAGTAPGALAPLAGPWLITFAIVAVNYAIAIALVRRSPLPALAVAVAVAALVLLAPGPDVSDEPVRVAAVQPGYETPDDLPALRNFRPGSWEQGALDVIDDLADLTERAAGAGAELVVWPEATMYVDPRRKQRVAAELGALAERTGAALVVPFFRPWPDRESGALAVRPGDGSLTAATGKQRPMWFLGEGALAADAGPIEIIGLRVGVLLGVDTQDPRAAARLAERGAGLLASATHDWARLGPHHHAAARIAARSAGLSLARTDWQYLSSLIDAEGAVLDDAGADLARTVLVADLAPAASVPPYARVGDALPLALAALLALALAFSAVRRGSSGE